MTEDAKIFPAVHVKKFYPPRIVEVKKDDPIVYNPVEDKYECIDTVRKVAELAKKAYLFDRIQYEVLAISPMERLIKSQLLPFFLLLRDYLRIDCVSQEAEEKMKAEVNHWIMALDGTMENCVTRLFAKIKASGKKEEYEKFIEEYFNEIEEESKNAE